MAHAKYMVVDGARAWVGTANWERDYFFQTRNVGLVVEGGPLPARLDAFFAQNWSSPYAEDLVKDRMYQPPRIGE